ncbi:dual specificity protein phosphatase 16 [Antennarius striatus]|uniref:dual specificity protein phosphatase 16 n=1 Tax=Antennarius striatus TaxID=241820 RepID=UPI0035AECC3F
MERGEGSGAVRPIGPQALVALLEGGPDRVVLIDSRPFVDFNSAHILEALNLNRSALMRRRLQHDKVTVTELLQHAARHKLDLLRPQEVVVYDQNSSDPAALSADSFLAILLVKLERSFPSVHLLSGGFSEFSGLFPGLCEGRAPLVPSCPPQQCPPLASVGPTCILPHLYLGCQRDVLNKDVMQQNDIGYVLNASSTCPQPDFIPDQNFLRVPVNDSFSDKILPWLDQSLEFIEEAKASNSRVLVHCLAGISRSATIAIAYIMKRMDLSLDEAYRFVKEKRPTISPNFNFLGQLLDFEKKIKRPPGAEATPPHRPEPPAPGPPAPGAGCGPCGAPLGPLTLPCVLDDAPEERLLARALSGLQLADAPEDHARLKRSFSLDIKSYGEVGGASHRVLVPHEGSGDGGEFYKPTPSSSKSCQFSPVEEVSEGSTPEPRPEQEEGGVRAPPSAAPPRAAPPRAAPPAPSSTLKGWHSDLLLGPVAVSSSSLGGGWYLGGLAAYGCGPGLEAVRRRGRRGGDGGASRRSWHEESSFEKQLKRRSCQMEDGGAGGPASFSGSMEVIQVS